MPNQRAVPGLPISSQVDLDNLTTSDLEIMSEAGSRLAPLCQEKPQHNVVIDVLGGRETVHAKKVYPPGGVIDYETGGHYFFHTHQASERFPGELGHFHVLFDRERMPSGIEPADVPKTQLPMYCTTSCHLVAIAVTRAGIPFRLFTTNRWVTGETWYRAEDVAALVDHFQFDATHLPHTTNAWVADMLCVFKPQIAELLQARDQVIETHSLLGTGNGALDDTRLAVTSYLDISVNDQLRAVDQALGKRRKPPRDRD